MRQGFYEFREAGNSLVGIERSILVMLPQEVSGIGRRTSSIRN